MTAAQGIEEIVTCYRSCRGVILAPCPPAGLAPGGVSTYQKGQAAGLCDRACTNGGSGRYGIDRARRMNRGSLFQGEKGLFS